MTRILVVAGTGSGVGKTSLTLGLARALSRRGLKVRTAKVGPDFLDPMQLERASGRPCFNLDTFMMGADYVVRLAQTAAAGMDLLLIEGVMGLFDGAAPESSQGSTLEIAQLLQAPLLLVADASGQARSFAATVAGFTRFEPNTPVAGIIANRVGSAGHGELLRSALSSAQLPPLVGALTDGALPHLPSRHLGLLAPDASVDGSSALDAMADAVETQLDLRKIIDLFGPLTAPGLPLPSFGFRRRLRLAVAEDAAFNFVYADFRQALAELGVEWIGCSPLRDRAIPQEAQALFLPGGYPEEHAGALADNREFLQSVQAFSRSHPIYAECGGLIYLGDSLLDRAGQRHTLSGVLPASFRMETRLQRLGYAEVELLSDALWGSAGDRCRGHEFHYSVMETEPPAQTGWQRRYQITYRRGPARFEGYQRGSILASYLHLHFASRPQCLNRLIAGLDRSEG